MDNDECAKALKLVAQIPDRDENAEDRNVSVNKRRPRRQRTCWHCGSIDHVVAKCPGRDARGKRLGETLERSDDAVQTPVEEEHELEIARTRWKLVQ